MSQETQVKVGKIGALKANEVERIASLGDWIVGTDAHARVLLAPGETVQRIPVADVSAFTMSRNFPTWGEDTMCVTRTPNLPRELALIPHCAKGHTYRKCRKEALQQAQSLSHQTLEWRQQWTLLMAGVYRKTWL
jgi:hypothetical protein